MTTKLKLNDTFILYLLIFMIGTLILSSFFLIGLGYSQSKGQWLWIMPLLMLFFCFISIIKIISLDWRYILSPISMFILTVCIFHGLGPLLYHFGDHDTIFWVNNRFYISESSLFRANLLVQVGLLFSLFGITLGKKLKLSRSIKSVISQTSKISIKQVLFILLLVGVPVKYFLILPYMMGVLNTVIPGAIYSLTNLILVALVLLSYLISINNTKLKFIYYILLVMEVSSGVLVMSKLWIILPILAVVLGRTIATRRTTTLIKGALLILTIFIIITPLILAARTDLSLNNDNKGIVDRLIAVSNAATNNNQNISSEDGQQWWWIRINYVPAQTLAMNMYDKGNNGESIFKSMTWVLIPRIIYPNKPVFDVSTQFSIMMNGNENNHDSPGAYGDIYWNYGWFGLVLLSFYMGLLLGWFHQLTLTVITKKNWLLFPLVLNITLVIGRGINNFFIKTYFIEVIFIIAQGIFLIFISIILFRKTMSQRYW
ncbi:hypothetical protein [Neobacillus drentensis]|uniref:hypothetical protein n=1 Tax=Neobacillus drentensis TaxID=220684 RepID=UPI0030038DE6